jgi:hypothetical protein
MLRKLEHFECHEIARLEMYGNQQCTSLGLTYSKEKCLVISLARPDRDYGLFTSQLRFIHDNFDGFGVCRNFLRFEHHFDLLHTMIKIVTMKSLDPTSKISNLLQSGAALKLSRISEVPTRCEGNGGGDRQVWLNASAGTTTLG